jgi:hypothetical protein
MNRHFKTSETCMLGGQEFTKEEIIGNAVGVPRPTTKY